MADVVNLNRFRKQKRRQAELVEAERKRLIHGRTKADKQVLERERERAERSLEGLRREPDPASVVSLSTAGEDEPESS